MGYYWRDRVCSRGVMSRCNMHNDFRVSSSYITLFLINARCTLGRGNHRSRNTRLRRRMRALTRQLYTTLTEDTVVRPLQRSLLSPNGFFCFVSEAKQKLCSHQSPNGDYVIFRSRPEWFDTDNCPVVIVSIVFSVSQFSTEGCIP